MLIRATALQHDLFDPVAAPIPPRGGRAPFRTQLLKWIGNKQKQADAIIASFPTTYRRYFEPFLGSGGVLGVLAPERAMASDTFAPLMEIWQMLHEAPERLKHEYATRYALVASIGKREAYERVRAQYNSNPNGADLVFLCRTCYGGVVRFRQQDGYMSTPCGAHQPVSPESFAKRVDIWSARTRGVHFACMDFAAAMAAAGEGDLVYCDPPYVDTQAILYGAQSFRIERLVEAIEGCKIRGARVALSIDGTKYSGRKLCNVPIPRGLFVREEFVPVGRSMLRRFQMSGQSLEHHVVSDRLLLTYDD